MLLFSLFITTVALIAADCWLFVVAIRIFESDRSVLDLEEFQAEFEKQMKPLRDYQWVHEVRLFEQIHGLRLDCGTTTKVKQA